MSAEIKGRAYVEEAQRELNQYTYGLLRENERLRAALAVHESEESELTRLRARLAEIEQENHHYAEQYQLIEQQTGNLSNLYVASYQLHSSVDRDEILKTIQEIVINLIGSEEIAIFEEDAAGKFQLSSSTGVDASRLGSFRLGEGPIGKRLSDGEVFVEDFPSNDGRLTACVPLKIGNAITGAIVVFRLLSHKTALERLDHELFELLAIHAATALYCAQLHAARSLCAAVTS